MRKYMNLTAVLAALALGIATVGCGAKATATDSDVAAVADADAGATGDTTADGATADAADTGAADGKTGDGSTADADAAATPAHWTYEGEEGPTHWGDLDPTYTLCKSGKAQTPIDIDATAVVPGLYPELKPEYKPSALNIWNNGHTVQVNYDAGSTLTLDGVAYPLVQFHFHAHSEHTIGGKSYPLELHLVHKTADSKLAVVGVLIEEGAENAALKAVFANLPTTKTDAAAVIAGATVDAAKILPEHLWVWRYDGSLTTPPCSEGVKWNVLQQTVTASKEQIGKLTALFADNFRPVQPLGDRTVDGAHFDYETGEEGPTHWGELAPTWGTCGSGQAQTPIALDVTATVPGEYPGLVPTYATSKLNILNNGHTVQVNYDAGSKITLDGVDYNLAQFHFHAHSEHIVNGVPAALELHLVHKDKDGNLAVVGVFLKEGAENAALKPVFDNLPATKSAVATVAGLTVDAGKFLPTHKWLWRYSGSLTTPPCSEGVKWNVFYEPVEASKAQIAKFTALFANDARPLQSLNGRVISGAHFEYDGEEGPDHWGELAPTWDTCKSGTAQSPIEIPAAKTPAVYAGLKLDYKSSALNIINNGHTVQVNYAAGSKSTLDGKDYALAQFHFHTHAEHTLEGKTAYPLEMHLVHKAADGALAVIGVFIQEGTENAALAKVFANLPAKAGPAADVAGATVDASAILPSDLSLWRYDGSLTTPPCSEGVKWHVLSTTIQASAAQIKAFKDLFANDARPPQALNGRVINP